MAPNIKSTLGQRIVFAGSVVIYETQSDQFNRYNAEKRLHKPWRPKGFFQFEIIINVLLNSFRSIWISMLRV